MNKKAIVITYYNAPNYGAFMQVYAMQMFLKNSGVEVYIYQHEANKKNLITKILNMRIDQDVLQYQDKIQTIINEENKKLNFNKLELEEFDLAILGSDEIWNIKNMTALHLPIFFNPYKNAKKTVSYAACCGGSKAKHLSMVPYCKEIRKLNMISVRDDNTEKMVKEFVKVEPVRTLDPTFLHDFDSELPENKIKDKYMLVYTYGLSKQIISGIANFAKNEGLIVVATGSFCPWADVNPVPTAFEWLSLIKYSNYVVTSTFHGSVFSVIFNKQFVSINTNSDKVKSFLVELNICDRLVDIDVEIGNTLKQPINYEEVFEVINPKRDSSKQFILDNL